MVEWQPNRQKKYSLLYICVFSFLFLSLRRTNEWGLFSLFISCIALICCEQCALFCRLPSSPCFLFSPFQGPFLLLLTSINGYECKWKRRKNEKRKKKLLTCKWRGSIIINKIILFSGSTQLKMRRCDNRQHAFITSNLWIFINHLEDLRGKCRQHKCHAQPMTNRIAVGSHYILGIITIVTRMRMCSVPPRLSLHGQRCSNQIGLLPHIIVMFIWWYAK